MISSMPSSIDNRGKRKEKGKESVYARNASSVSGVISIGVKTYMEQLYYHHTHTHTTRRIATTFMIVVHL